MTTARERDLMEIVHSWRIAAMTAEMLGDHSRSGTLGECANDLETALLARPPETREEGRCPGCGNDALISEPCGALEHEAMQRAAPPSPPSESRGTATCQECGASLAGDKSCIHHASRTVPPAPPEKPRLPVRTRNHLTGEALKTAMERANPRPSLEDLDVPSEEPERCPKCGDRGLIGDVLNLRWCSCKTEDERRVIWTEIERKADEMASFLGVPNAPRSPEPAPKTGYVEDVWGEQVEGGRWFQHTHSNDGRHCDYDCGGGWVPAPAPSRGAQDKEG